MVCIHLCRCLLLRPASVSSCDLDPRCIARQHTHALRSRLDAASLTPGVSQLLHLCVLLLPPACVSVTKVAEHELWHLRSACCWNAHHGHLMASLVMAVTRFRCHVPAAHTLVRARSD